VPALIQASIVTSIRFGSISGFFGTVIVTRCADLSLP
jgi:hypothetical protein